MTKKLEGPLCFKQENPKRSGTKAHERYEKYKAAKTVEEALALGASRGDITNDIKAGICSQLDGAAAAADVNPASKRPADALGPGSAQEEPPEKRAALAPPAAPPVAPPAAPPAVQAAPAAVEAASTAGTSSSSSSGAKPTSASEAAAVDLSFTKMDGKPIKFIKRVMGEAKKILMPSGVEEGKKSGYEFSLKDRDCLSRWGVRLCDLNPEGHLAKDLIKHKLDKSIDLEIILPNGFPLEPPFARVVYPQLSGGYVFSHGGICFEPLTNKGWVPSMSLPALAIAIKGIMDYGDVRVAGAGDRASRTVSHYTEEGARKDHSVIVAAHRGGEGSSYGSLKNYRS